MDCKHFEIVHVYQYIYIYKESLSRCKNRNSSGMWQKNQMKIQDRGEGNFLEKSQMNLRQCISIQNTVQHVFKKYL